MKDSETIMQVEGLENCSMPIDNLIELLTNKKEEGYTTVYLSCYGEGAMGGGAEACLEVN